MKRSALQHSYTHALLVSITLGLTLSACHGGEPPAPTGFDAAVSPLPPPPASPASPASPAAKADSQDGAPTATADAAVAATASGGADAGDAIDPGTLPQTHDKPEPMGPAFDARVAALWDAIVKDDPDRGLSAFFPVTAYEQVKGIPNPASDWRHRLVANYKRDIHALHKRLGDHAADVKLLHAEIPMDRARWVEPNEESNRLGYYRVYGTRLVYEDAGKERSFEVTSLISWRGAWYVVHLSGFK